ncbi:MAG: phosphotransferase family protein [Acidimicrobiia bacterium]
MNLPEGVDGDVLVRWMDEQGLAAGALEEVTPLTGGTQNILVRFRRGSGEYVLRRGPLHLRPRSNDGLRREARILAVLDRTDVPHPGFVAACDDEAVMHGAVFYLMEPVDGFNPTVELPPLHASSPAVRHAMGLHAVDAAAALGALDHEALGLADFGRPDGFIERQVDRWRTELESYSRFDGYPGPELPDVDGVARWLADHRPEHWRPGIMHGDFHLANLLYEYDSPRVAAVVDWEMCTIGDPLLDLGWLLATWPDERGVSLGLPAPPELADGAATPAELIERYAVRSTRDLASIDWYRVLACYKLGIVLEGSNARADAGQAPREIGDLLHTLAVGLFERAHAVMA